MTTTDRQTLRDLRDAVADLDGDLESALGELAEIKARIADIREDRRWRMSAIKYLRETK